MLHRHLNHQGFTLAAIDDLISRGRRRDWADLRRAALADRSLIKKIRQVCRPRASDPTAQRYHFWRHYMSNASLPDWERVLSSAARLQRILPDAVLVGGTASALHARHRFSRDADHVLTDLRHRFDTVLRELESVAGWKTARVRAPVQILGSLDGIETGVRQLIRKEPLETLVIDYHGKKLKVPSEREILRIKAVLILKRNATRDYLDFVALADHLGDEKMVEALRRFDHLYPQENGESALQQLQIQLASPIPFDLEETRLSEYKNLDPKWHDWNAVKAVCAHCATTIFDGLSASKDARKKTSLKKPLRPPRFRKNPIK